MNIPSTPLIRFLSILLAASQAAVGLGEAVTRVTNVTDGDQLHYPLALLKGIHVGIAKELSVRTSGVGASELSFPIASGRFKALVMLREGDNEIILDDGGASPEIIHLHYAPQTSGNWMRMIYFLGSDSDGTFDAPQGEPNNIESAVARISTGALLMQTLTAEKMAERGYGRQTFRLKTDATGMPLVEVIRSHRSEQFYYNSQANSGDGAFWEAIWEDLASLPDRARSKDIVVASFTRYDGRTKKIKGHTALGGDRLGLFGSATLHTWAPDIGEVRSRFSDARNIDTSRLFDDSGGRGSYWANYATGLGATLHEMGHTLDLPHTDGYASMPNTGIMSRGFDDVNLAFMLKRPGDGRVYYDDDGRALWHDESAKILSSSRWITAPPPPPDVELNLNELIVNAFDDIGGAPYHLTNTMGSAAAVRSLGFGKGKALRLTSLTEWNNNAIAWDALPFGEGRTVLSFDFRISDDASNNANGGCCGQAADGFGIGFFKTSRYGTSGALNPGADGSQWEDPSFGSGFRDAMVFGFDVFDANPRGIIRAVWSGGNSNVAQSGSAPFVLNDDQFHRAMVTIDSSSDGRTTLSLRLIQDVNGIAREHSVFAAGEIPGFRLEEGYRLIAGGRTGAAFAETWIDNVSLASQGGKLEMSEPTLSIELRPQNVIAIGVQSEIGGSFRLESSVDLRSWNPEGIVNVQPNRQAVISRSAPADGRQRFYRIVR